MFRQHGAASARWLSPLLIIQKSFSFPAWGWRPVEFRDAGTGRILQGSYLDVIREKEATPTFFSSEPVNYGHTVVWFKMYATCFKTEPCHFKISSIWWWTKSLVSCSSFQCSSYLSDGVCVRLVSFVNVSPLLYFLDCDMSFLISCNPGDCCTGG